MEKKEFDFEESVEKLDLIAKKLEEGNESLDDSIKLFEEGMELSKKCSDFLSQAEKRITVLIDNDEEIEEKDFTAE